MIRTKRDDFTDYQLHVEFATPSEVKGNSQGRGNSGVFLNGVFEIQVLDSYDNKSYADGQASAMYGQYPADGERVAAAGRVAVLRHRVHGAALQRHDAREAGGRHRAAQRRRRPRRAGVPGPDRAQADPPYAPSNAKGFIGLQDHGNPVRFRNIWIRAAESAE